MTAAFTHEIDHFIVRHHVMSLAVSSTETLWAASVFYSFDASRRRLLYFTSPNTAHGRMTLANPSVAATIAEQEREIARIQGVQIRGRSTMLHGADALRARALFLAGFSALGVLTTPIWALVPDYVKMVDNTRGFGHKDEWSSPA